MKYIKDKKQCTPTYCYCNDHLQLSVKFVYDEEGRLIVVKSTCEEK